MKNIKLQLKLIMKSNSIKDMLGNITWDMVEFIAFVPILLFMLTPLYQLVYDIFTYNRNVNLSYTYSENINSFTVVISAIGIVMLLICAGKHRMQSISTLKQITALTSMRFFIPMSVLMVVSTIINGLTPQALFGDIYRNESLFKFIIYIFIYFVCAACVHKQHYKQKLILTYIIISDIIAVLALIHSTVYPLYFFSNKSGLATVFHQFNHYGYFLLMSILLCGALSVLDKNLKMRMFYGFSFAINTVVLIINDTFGCYIACFIGLIFCCIVISVCEKKFSIGSFILILAFVLISILMSTKYTSVWKNIMQFLKDLGLIAKDSDDAKKAGTGRWDLWANTVKYIKEKPIFGFGVEGIGERLNFDTNGNNNRPHNEFLQYAAFFGVPAAILYVCGVFSVFLNALKNKKKIDMYSAAALICAFGYLVSSVFGNTMYYTAPFLFIFLGLGFVV